MSEGEKPWLAPGFSYTSLPLPNDAHKYIPMASWHTSTLRSHGSQYLEISVGSTWVIRITTNLRALLLDGKDSLLKMPIVSNLR